MNRMEFMQILESKLSDMPDSERKEALQYYNDYFDDAGVENEQEVMEALGSPEQVAKTLKSDLNGRENGEYTERGYRTEDSVENQPVGIRNQENQQNQKGQESEYGDKRNVPRENPLLKIILIVLICIILSPIIIPVGAAILGIAFGLLIAAIGIFLGAAISGIVFLIVGAICLIIGIVKVFINPLAGTVILGSSFLLLGLGILLTIFMIWICIRLIPMMVRGIVRLIRWPFERKGGCKA